MSKGYEVLNSSNFGISDPFNQELQAVNGVCPNYNCSNCVCICGDNNCACNDIDCSTRIANR